MKYWTMIAIAAVAIFVGHSSNDEVISSNLICRKYETARTCDRGLYRVKVISLEPKTYGYVLATIKGDCVIDVEDGRIEITDVSMEARGMVTTMWKAQVPKQQAQVCRIMDL